VNKAQFGIIGLGTMGRNLALNLESNGYSVAVWNLETEWTDDFVRANKDLRFIGAKTLPELVQVLDQPRRIVMMIPAGDPVESTIKKLQPLLERGDILMDGGNSWYEDTRRREAQLRPTGLQFVGCGVSGGEEGARYGPALMPGGSVEAWSALHEGLERIAAKTEAGPCVTHVGPDGAGHFVKMVHNGIEYGDMQLIAESWDVMRRGLAMTASQTADVFARWNEGPLGSFLVELTAQVNRVTDPETNNALVDMVEDRAGQKGTGRWTAQIALDLGVAIPTIAASIDARVLSSMKSQRVAAERVLSGPDVRSPFSSGGAQRTIDDLADALYASRICGYAQGMALIRQGSDKYAWNINLAEIARIWKGGCIIRARLLDPVRHAFAAQPSLDNLLLDTSIAGLVQSAQPGWRRLLARAVEAGIPMPAHSASLAYFDSVRTARLPQNLTQAQRDAFGAHKYERTDRPGSVHSQW
jgi:6-phosphogluconate dehydrogenase